MSWMESEKRSSADSFLWRRIVADDSLLKAKICRSISMGDGFDTLEWIAKQPWCNGKIGTWEIGQALPNSR
jgi:predicted acyl esterase